MFVYIVSGHVAFEGDDLIGVYLDEQTAVQVAKETASKSHYSSVAIGKWDAETSTFIENVYCWI